MAVIGASDGKFVLPLAAAGHHVIAVEKDPFALHGGEVSLPGDTTAHALGLTDRLKRESLDDQVQVIEQDFLQADLPEARCDAVWTSCSWHYSANHHTPLADFVTRMQALVRVGGLFGAEFMMPVERRHHLIEHYTSPRNSAATSPPTGTSCSRCRTNQFTERPHIGRPHDHTHRMGLLLAARTGT